MSKRYLKRPPQKNFCTACGAEGGLLLITMPRHLFQRPRTDKENERFQKVMKGLREGTTTELQFKNFWWQDRQDRTVKLCKEHLKPLWEKQFTTKVSEFKV